MITTVTTTTTVAATTIAAASLALIVVLALLVLLIQREIAGGLEGEHARRMVRALNIAIIPLAIIFVASALIKVSDLLH